MQLFVEMIDSQVPDMHERGARVRFVGRREGAPDELVRRIEEAEALTAGNTKMTLYIAFGYGGRRELLDAAQGLAAEYCASAFEGDVGRAGERAGLRRRRSSAPPLRSRDARPGAAASAPPGSSASATSCSGSAPTRSCTSATGTGRTSVPTTWMRPWPTTPAASAASAAAARPPRRRRRRLRCLRRRRSGILFVSTRIITGLVLGVLAVVLVAHGGLIFFFVIAALSLLALNEFYRLTRMYRPLPLAGFLGVALMVSMAWFYSPIALFGAIAAGVLLHGAARARGGPQAGRHRPHGGHRARHAVHRPRVQRRPACSAPWTTTA